MARFKPAQGKRIHFWVNKKKHEGRVDFIGSNGTLAVTDHDVPYKDTQGKPLVSDHWVEKEEVIGEVV